eukprot:3928241-Rhodomonas_salina.1
MCIRDSAPDAACSRPWDTQRSGEKTCVRGVREEACVKRRVRRGAGKRRLRRETQAKRRRWSGTSETALAKRRK